MASALDVLKAAKQELRRLLDNGASADKVAKASKKLAKAQKDPRLRRKR